MMLHFGIPAAMWIVAGYYAVVRFLSYLDLRIRREGWEPVRRQRQPEARRESGRRPIKDSQGDQGLGGR